MGLFDFFKKAAEPAKPEPVSGKAVQLSETSDPVFSSEAMGKGIAIEGMHTAHIGYVHHPSSDNLRFPR